MKSVSALGFLLALFVTLPVGALEPGKYPIMQGVTTATTIRTVVLHKKGEVLKLNLEKDSKRIRPSLIVPITFPGSEWQTTQAEFGKLKAGNEYSLQISGADGKVLDARKLRTLDPTKKKPRLAFASRMEDAYGEQTQMWKDLLGNRPDVLFMMGDNAYADKVKTLGPITPAILWSRYVETRMALEVFRHEDLVPIFATWDDHDYGMKDGDLTFAHKDEVKKIFLAFFPQSTSTGAFTVGPGIASLLSAYGQDFYLMDDRTFRTPKGATPETHWGKTQEDWLFTNLKLGKQPAWILNGDQYFGAYHPFDSYEGNHPTSFKEFLGRLGGMPVPAVLVSGDRHLAELQEIKSPDLPYLTYELTTSAIHAKTYPDAWAKTPNARKIEGASGVLNYVIVESTAGPGPGLAFDLTAYGPSRAVLFHRNLRVKRESSK